MMPKSKRWRSALFRRERAAISRGIGAMDEALPDRQLVLLGAGHTNAHILRMWRMQPIAGVGLTCISNFPMATYSGMLPAVLAGQVPESAMQIDLVRLCSAVGARLIVDQVTGIDRRNREIRLREFPPVPFDALSIGIGSVPTTSGVEGADEFAVKIKPMQTFLERLRGHLARVQARRGALGGAQAAGSAADRLRVVIVGGGAAGVEIACCLPGFLRAHGFESQEIAIVAHSPLGGSDLAEGTRRRLERHLERRGIGVLTGRRVVAVTRDRVCSDDGREVPADLTLWATGAVAPPELAEWDFPKDDRGFLRTDATLRVVSGDPVFVVGDTGTIDGVSIPKAGVYAVREGPVLWHNLRSMLDAGQVPASIGPGRFDPNRATQRGDARAVSVENAAERQGGPSRTGASRAGASRTGAGLDLRAYRPQRSFLKLINLGDGSAVGQWHGLSFEGRWVMRLKLKIDTRFMEKFDPGRLVMAEGAAMSCRGCGCKVGAEPLRAALAAAPRPIEDAALLESAGEHRLLASVDFFATPLADPFLAGRIAAVHACSDVLACGAQPHEVLAIAVVPEGNSLTQQRFLSDLLAGARHELERLGASIVGGHTIAGPRAEIGFSVVGRPMGTVLLTKSGLRIGDRLYLTKPLGVGVLLAAHMRAACRAEDFSALLRTMLDAQQPLIQATVRNELSAATDVTGFGLAGHLLEMLEASQVAAELDLGAIPLLSGVGSAVAAGIESTLAPANARNERAIDVEPAYRCSPQFRALFDPQTCGGYLIGVPVDREDAWLAEVHGLGYTPGRIGTVVACPDKASARMRVRGTSSLALNETR
ncbi:MAG: selenide, water dikinase SelD [Planctomycetota bacterium]|nr:MAG: selenide, water dikinase SelD [Planctomycetota bacterium]